MLSLALLAVLALSSHVRADAIVREFDIQLSSTPSLHGLSCKCDTSPLLLLLTPPVELHEQSGLAARCFSPEPEQEWPDAASDASWHLCSSVDENDVAEPYSWTLVAPRLSTNLFPTIARDRLGAAPAQEPKPQKPKPRERKLRKRAKKNNFSFDWRPSLPKEAARLTGLSALVKGSVARAEAADVPPTYTAISIELLVRRGR